MKKIFLLLVFFCSVLLLSAQIKPTITVLDFKTNNISEGDMQSIISFLSAELFDIGIYTVIDSSQRDTILKELKFSMSGCTDESCQLEIGRMLSAEMIVVGDLGQIGSRFILTAKILETETSKTLGIAKGIYPDIDALLDDMNSFALKLVKGEKLLSINSVVEIVPEDSNNKNDNESVIQSQTIEEPVIIAENSNETLTKGFALDTGIVFGLGNRVNLDDFNFDDVTPIGGSFYFGLNYQFNNVFSLGFSLFNSVDFYLISIDQMTYSTTSFSLSGTIDFIFGNKVEGFAFLASIGSGLLESAPSYTVLPENEVLPVMLRAGIYYKNFSVSFAPLLYFSSDIVESVFPMYELSLGYSFFFGEKNK